MISKEGSWSIVIVGKWNRHILSPEWVGKNIFNEEEIKVEFPVNAPDLPPRYITQDNILFVPGNHRINFIAQKPYHDETLEKISVMNRTLVEILKHTPISALGINFGFEEHQDNFKMLEIFGIRDNDSFVDVMDSTAELIEIKRQFNLDDCLLNLSLNYLEDMVGIDFNFHYSITDTANLIEILENNLILKKRDIALNILRIIYGLELEEE